MVSFFQDKVSFPERAKYILQNIKLAHYLDEVSHKGVCVDSQNYNDMVGVSNRLCAEIDVLCHHKRYKMMEETISINTEEINDSCSEQKNYYITVRQN